MANQNLTQTLSPAQASTPALDSAIAAGRSGGGHSPVATSPAPYHCSCGARSPYLGRKPKHRGGNGCKACSSIVNAISGAQSAAYNAIAAAAYQVGVSGAEKTAIITEATRAATEAWRAAQLSYGVGVVAGDELAAAPPVPTADLAPDVEQAPAAAPRPTASETIAAALLAHRYHCSWVETTKEARELAALGKALVKLETQSRASLEWFLTAENVDPAKVEAARLLLEARAAPRPTRTIARYDGPDSFGVSAIGGTEADVVAAIIDQLREMAVAGLIGPQALTDAGNDLMNVAQDAELRGAA